MTSLENRSSRIRDFCYYFCSFLGRNMWEGASLLRQEVPSYNGLLLLRNAIYFSFIHQSWCDIILLYIYIYIYIYDTSIKCTNGKHTTSILMNKWKIFVQHTAFFSVIKIAASNVLDICSRYDDYLLFLSLGAYSIFLCYQNGSLKCVGYL